MKTPPSSERALPTVLMSVIRPSDDGNPYVRLLVETLRDEGISASYFSWTEALVGRYDVFHVHWPETMLRGKGPLRSLAKSTLYALLMVRLKLTRTTVVRTQHNSQPHEGYTRREKFLVGVLERMESGRVVMTSPEAAGTNDSYIPHGDYRRSYTAPVSVGATDRRLLFFGAIRPYKRVVELCEVFREYEDPLATLHVAGFADDPRLHSAVVGIASTDARISLDLRRVPAEDLAAEIAASSLVVLPFEGFENSGSALLALSLDRPVLVPHSDTSARLQREVGARWVHTFNGALSVDGLREVVEKVSGEPVGPEDRVVFEGRDWAEVAHAHARFYERSWQRSRHD